MPIKVGTKRPPRSIEWCERLSLGHMGQIPWNKGLQNCFTPAMRKRMSKAHIGNTGWWKGKKRPEMKGVKNHKWRGDEVGNMALHDWIKRYYGLASKCENRKCLGKSKIYQWANISGKYKRRRSDFKQLCVSCHRRYDDRKRRLLGHKIRQ